MHMQMPVVQDQHRRLHKLAGTWVGEETIHPSAWDPEGGPAVARVESRVALDGFNVITDYSQERGGQVCYRGHGVFGWDPSDQSYTLHWYDSMGSACSAPARGRWEGDRLSFEMSNPMGHSRYLYTLEADDRYTFEIQFSEDGRQWRPFMTGRYSRR